MDLDILEHLRALHPLAHYSLNDIIDTANWRQRKRRNRLRATLEQLLAGFPPNPDVKPNGYLGARWMSAFQDPLPIRAPLIDVSTHALGQALLRKSPRITAKFFLLPPWTINRDLIPTVVSAVALWRPCLCVQS